MSNELMCMLCGESFGAITAPHLKWYNTLIIWEHELKDLEIVEQKILNFTNVS